MLDTESFCYWMLAIIDTQCLGLLLLDDSGR